MKDYLGAALGESLGKLAAKSQTNSEQSQDMLTKESLELRLFLKQPGKGDLPNAAGVPELKLTDLPLPQKLQNEISAKDIKEYEEQAKSGRPPENIISEF
jgi:hypothetical protein